MWFYSHLHLNHSVFITIKKMCQKCCRETKQILYMYRPSKSPDY